VTYGAATGSGASGAEEEVVWQGRPSQIINLPAFLLCTLLCILVVPIFVALWKWLVVRCTNYELTSERLRMGSGVLSRVHDELELYRVKDSRYEQPFLLRIFGLGNVVLSTSDRTHPTIELRAVRDGRDVREKLRAQVEKLRARKGVREVD
jgi:membrane protein YdbS with pleckstrin-like domain